VLASVLLALGAPELLVTVPALLSALNLMLALFNLVPAFPLDGGRVLRGFLWQRHGDKLQATRAAARTGRVFGWAFVTGGILLAFTGVAVSGVWLVFIGLFIVLASTAESAEVEGQALLTGVQVGEVMTPDPITAPADITVDELLDTYVLRSRASAYPVLDGDELVGLVTLDRVRQVPPASRHGVSVRSIACPLDQVPTAAPATPLVDLLPPLVRSGEGRALVLDQGRLVGIVSNTDVSRAIEVRAITPTGGARPPAPAGARPNRAFAWPPPPHRSSPTPT
jgi:CBS domain-containing protein